MMKSRGWVDISCWVETGLGFEMEGIAGVDIVMKGTAAAADADANNLSVHCF